MAFDINKARTLAGTSTSTPQGGGFNIEKARAYGQGTNAAEPISVSSALESIKQTQEQKQEVRLPFSQQKVQMGGLNNFIIRGATNIIYRAMEDIAVGGLKVAAQITDKEIKTPKPITSEPFLGGAPVTQDTFQPMAQAALERIKNLDIERPEKRNLNLIQGTAEEVFLPVLNAVDIVGLSSIATRLARKVTFSKEASSAFKTLNMDLLSDTSEAGIRRHFASEVQKNIDRLRKGKLTPQQFVERMDEVGDAIDVLTEAPRARFGKLGEKINNLSTALEAERKIGRAADPTFQSVREAAKSAIRTAEARKLDVVSEGAESAVKIGKVTDDIPEELRPQAEEARKYGSAEEFVSSKINAQHGTDAKFTEFKKTDPAKGEANYFSEVGGAKASALSRRGNLMDVAIDESRVKTFDPQMATDEVRRIVQQAIDNIHGKGKYRYDPDAPIATREVINKVDDTLQAEVIRLGSREGYNDFRFYEPSTQEWSRAITDNSLIKTREQLTDLYNKATRQAETPPATKPQPPEGKKVSKLGARINENLPEGSKIDEFYDTITIKGELEKAAKSIEKDPVKALADALNPEKSMTGRAAKLMEFAQSARDRGDVSVQSALLSKMRVLGTEIAQGLNMFKAYGFSNPETDFMQQVVEARLRKVHITAEDISRAGTPNRAYNEKVYAPIRKEVERIKRQAFKVEDAQKLFDDLVC